jgi:tetratricopeptide (TPR) repeat protein
MSHPRGAPPTSRTASLAALSVLVALGAAAVSPAAAQRRADLGTIEVSLPHGARPSAFVDVAPPPLPDVAPGAFPESARPPAERWRDAIEDARSAAARAAPVDERRERVERVGREAVALEAALAQNERALSREALLVLGELRFGRAVEAYEQALDRYDGSAPEGGEPRLDATAALQTWSRITGDDLVVAYASLRTARALARTARPQEALALHERAIALGASDPSFVAYARFFYAETLDELGRPARSGELYDLAGRSGPPNLQAAAAFRAVGVWRALNRVEPTVEAAARLFELGSVQGELADEALRLAATALASAGAEAARRVPASVPSATRARLLLEVAEQLMEGGSASWARAALDAIASDLDRAQRARSEAMRARADAYADEPRGWLLRSARHCLDATRPWPTIPEGQLELELDAARNGAPRLRSARTAPSLEPVRDCLEHRAPPYEGRFTPPRARVVLRIRGEL